MPRRISTVVGREFGDALRPVMERAGVSMRQLAARLGWDHPKLSDLVNGKGGSTEAELTFLLGVCGATAKERDHLVALFRQSRERGWLQLYDSAVPEQVRTLVEHEKVATSITVWSPLLVPGLLQIPAYVRAVVLASPLIPAKHVDEVVAARTERRDIIEGLRRFTFYVHESALWLPVGGQEVREEQLHDLLRMSVRPQISLRIVPTASGAHAGFCGAFRLMKFAKIEPVVYQESLNSGLFLDDTASISLHEKVVAALDQMALSAEESRRLITSIVT